MCHPELSSLLSHSSSRPSLSAMFVSSTATPLLFFATLLSAARPLSVVAVAPFPGPTLVGPLVCADPSCPTQLPGGPVVNNSNFHLRDISISLAGDDGYFYLTGTSTSAGDGFWSDVYGVVRMWRSATLAPGSFEPGGRVVYNATRDCPGCGECIIPNTPAACPSGKCARVWAPEYHYLPSTLAAVPRAGGHFIALHLHCSGGFSGVLASTTGHAYGPYEAINTAVHGGDVTLFAAANGTVFAGSSGPLQLARLSSDLATVEEVIVVSQVCDAECSHLYVGFEGMQFLSRGGAFFLCASAYGNATAHGGPRWPAIGNETASSNIFYSTYCGRADTIRGPFLDPSGDAGGWLSVPKGGHNTYFTDAAGNMFSTLWYGSSARDMPPSDVPLVDLPSLVSVDIVDGRLVALGTPSWVGAKASQR